MTSSGPASVGALSSIGVNPTSIGVPLGWWLDAARSLEAAGFGGVYCWDHFMTRGRNRTDPVLECWTTLTAAAALTGRMRVGSLVSNIMNRHPAVLARATATLAELAPGRVDVAVGLGGHHGEHGALGIPFPEPPERLARLAEALPVMKLLWTGGPSDFEGEFYPLREAYAFPVPDPAPRLIVGAARPRGVALAARHADGWTSDAGPFMEHLPLFRETAEAAGRDPATLARVVTLDLERDVPADEQPILGDLAGTLAAWQERGATEIVINWVRPKMLHAVLDAAEDVAS
jgi:alkanesulfonate monooxygenase SsuD/methylene tetrahydromethanopterin reductase-like flavin-dependent oxidoreductase (luciferase family)